MENNISFKIHKGITKQQQVILLSYQRQSFLCNLVDLSISMDPENVNEKNKIEPVDSSFLGSHQQD